MVEENDGYAVLSATDGSTSRSERTDSRATVPTSSSYRKGSLQMCPECWLSRDVLARLMQPFARLPHTTSNVGAECPNSGFHRSSFPAESRITARTARDPSEEPLAPRMRSVDARAEHRE
ncbi:MAG: hypothetical protein IPH49_04845 [Ignavibacteria bacterium]|nr:hypothetical protein [Ignavibacteria bacterium]